MSRLAWLKVGPCWVPMPVWLVVLIMRIWDRRRFSIRIKVRD